MIPPVANPPAPDVEAIARDIAERTPLGAGGSPWRLWLQKAIASALTAHTASLREKVEELERERVGLKADLHAAWAEAAACNRGGLENYDRATAAEADANRMREALETAAYRLDTFMLLPAGAETLGDIMDLGEALKTIRAALSPRPADEPVTLGER